ncbi:MAG: molybdopterin molybdotransferase MoeA [Rhodospirillaceae bacterium]|jgi:molybdopterin molybdotransferase|nr:molybdopterin molybdotransferase MoeA [Rhodospirillaceae bacterium]MBT5564177.1 molybdopterin molybdotransferase MoeA [Rhodospirillaceae bacterium]MBT6089972.1 molybdopterin molybdotransferase MoeA [Rhodospirillaceae bacterium]
MISVAQAQSLVRDGITPIGTETVSLSDSLNRVLAENPDARIAHPAHTVSAMDGYAVRAENIPTVPGTLSVIGESAAGHPFEGKMEDGQAVRIFTGAHLPSGADTVVIQEDVDRDGDTITVKEIEPGRHIRPKAQDFNIGDTLLISPLRLSARHIGLLAAGDRPWLQVYRRPRVAIVSTGDEIVLPGEPRSSSQIVSANGPALSSFVKARGGVPVHLGVVKDDEDALTAIAEAAKSADLIVTSGGVSVGDRDLVRKAFDNAGLDVGFHKIAMRPGKPLMFGHLDDTPMLGLPGNPVSALVCALLFLGPAIDRLQGLPGDAPITRLATLGADVNANGGREDYMRAVLSHDEDGSLTATPIFAQDSSMMGALANSDALIVRPIGAPASKLGEAVPVLPLDGLL